jgi:IS5 family transposase
VSPNSKRCSTASQPYAAAPDDPDLLVADRGYDHKNYRRRLRRRGIPWRIARRQTEHGSGRGRWR